jgi:hypothetical protein
VALVPPTHFVTARNETDAEATFAFTHVVEELHVAWFKDVERNSLVRKHHRRQRKHW